MSVEKRSRDGGEGSELPSILFVGCGMMGLPMARHLIKAGFSVHVWNRTEERLQPLIHQGGLVVEALTESVRESQITICMLSTGQVVNKVLFEPDDSGRIPVEGMKPESTLIVMSSIPVELTQRQASILKERGVAYIDAPVSGGEQGAIDGTLAIMAGGSSHDLKRVEPILTHMGNVTHIGPVGTGQLAKLANQLIVGITIGAVAEALLMCEKGNADSGKVREALFGGFADSTVLRTHGGRMIIQNFEPGGLAEHQLKDLVTASKFAQHRDINLPLLKTATDLFQKMCDRGQGKLDQSALYLELRDYII